MKHSRRVEQKQTEEGLGAAIGSCILMFALMLVVFGGFIAELVGG